MELFFGLAVLFVQGNISSILLDVTDFYVRYLLSTNFNQMSELIGILNQHSSHVRPLALELGAGCGIVSIVLWLLGYDVITTDKLTVLDVLIDNINQTKEYIKINYNDLYNTLGTIQIIEFDWFSLSKSEDHSIIHLNTLINNRIIDLIVCSDCCYSTISIIPLINVLQLLSTNSTAILLVNEQRTALDEFLTLARKHELKTLTYQDIILSESDMQISIAKQTLTNDIRPVRALLGKFIEKIN